jgi:hypothetical protein
MSDGPARSFAAVTPSDSTDFAGGAAAALFVGVGGNVVVVGVEDSDGAVVETFKNVASGTILPVRCRRVNATSTTATDIKALYL